MAINWSEVINTAYVLASLGFAAYVAIVALRGKE